jgi:hypothetical protein
MKKFVWAALFSLPWVAQAEMGVGMIAEGAAVFESVNKARIPGTGTSLVDLTKSKKDSPLLGGRIYLSYKINDRHSLRALWAPLKIEGQLSSDASIDFAGETFAPGGALSKLYKFNSYRVTYAYTFDDVGDWRFVLGGTLKIRDAEIRLSRGTQVGSKKNVGLVPLLHGQVIKNLGENWSVKLDADALAAPQGRAFDGALVAERFATLFGAGHALYVYAGYRMLEGGADNDTVYNFAWFQSVVLGLRGAF